MGYEAIGGEPIWVSCKDTKCPIRLRCQMYGRRIRTEGVFVPEIETEITLVDPNAQYSCERGYSKIRVWCKTKGTVPAGCKKSHQPQQKCEVCHRCSPNVTFTPVDDDKFPVCCDTCKAKGKNQS